MVLEEWLIRIKLRVMDQEKQINKNGSRGTHQEESQRMDSKGMEKEEWVKRNESQRHAGRNCFNLFQISFSDNTTDAHPGVLGISKVLEIL